MTRSTCPACDVPIDDYNPVGPITVVLEPCGHQVDDRLLADLDLSGGDEGAVPP